MSVCSLLVHSSQKYANAPHSLHHTFEHLQNIQSISVGNPTDEITAGTSFDRISAHAAAAFCFLSACESRYPVFSDLDDDSLGSRKCSCELYSFGRASYHELAVVSALGELEAS